MKRVCILWMLGCVLVGSAWAQKTGTVYGKGSGKISINLSAYRVGGDSASKTFLSVLRADLNRSGYFKVSSVGAELNVSGSCGASGNVLKATCSVSKTSSRQRLLGKSYQTQPSDARGLAHRVADEILYAVTGKKGMASGKIALVYQKGKIKELALCDMDGKNVRQITHDKSIVVGPSWSPNGKSVLYTSYKRGYPNIYMTGNKHPVSSFGGLNASGALSPDGRTLAVILSIHGSPDLYLVNIRTRKIVKRLTKTRRGIEASPTWSPDGTKIAYVSDAGGSPQIYIISKNGGRPMRLTSSGSENVAPDWGKNGYIAFCTRTGGRYNIAIANPSSRTLRVLETDWADYEDPSWAPDGRHIICSKTSKYRSSIYLLDTMKDSPVALISGSGNWYSPACSP